MEITCTAATTHTCALTCSSVDGTGANRSLEKKNSVIKIDNFGHILIETYRWKNEQARLQGVEKPSREDLFEIKALQKKIDTWDLTKLLWTNIPWP